MKKAIRAKKNWLSFFVILCFCFPMLLMLILPLSGQRGTSILENRALKRLPVPSFSSFLEGTFQEDLEDALIDQLPLGEEIKGFALDRKHDALKLQQRLLYAAAPQVRSNYSPIADGYYHYAGDEHRIVERPKPYDQAHLEQLAASFGDIPGVKRFVYFIDNSRTVDFDRPEENGAVYQQVIDALKPDGADLFQVPDYAAYCRNFYQTDHHWNAVGSYAGYQGIYRLLHGTEDGMLTPKETIETDAVFQGSYARQTHTLCADEPFSFQTFDLPKFSTEINGRRRAYGNVGMYEKKKYPTDALSNHYANCFGGDFGQIVYDFGTSGKGNLLLVASSYSNPINALIAAGFDKTYVVDLRYYQDWAGKPFDPAFYCQEYGIDQVLLLGDVNLFYVDGPEEGVEQ